MAAETIVRQNGALVTQLSVLFAIVMLGVATWLAASGQIEMNPVVAGLVWLALLAALAWSLRLPRVRVVRRDGAVVLYESYAWGRIVQRYAPGDRPPEMVIRETTRNGHPLFHLDLVLPSGKRLSVESAADRAPIVGRKQQLLNVWAG